MNNNDQLLSTALALGDAISDNIWLVREITGSLEALAHSFAVTGNEHMANKLLAYCDPLEASAQRIRDAHMNKQNAELRHNEGFSRDLIMGLIGVVTADVGDDPAIKKKVAAIKDTRLMRGEGLA